MTIVIDLQIATTSDTLPTLSQLQRWVELAVNPEKSLELTIRIVDTEESQALNLQFRGKDKPTNVLSFPFDDSQIQLDIPLLGDLVICAAVVNQEAVEQKKPVEAHWAHLVIHGCLHLLGYDHQQEDEAALMEQKEIELLQQLGYDNPYV